MNKKQVILTGRLAAPLCEGSRAWIRHHSGLVCTSRVVRIQSLGRCQEENGQMTKNINLKV